MHRFGWVAICFMQRNGRIEGGRERGRRGEERGMKGFLKVTITVQWYGGEGGGAVTQSRRQIIDTLKKAH